MTTSAFYATTPVIATAAPGFSELVAPVSYSSSDHEARYNAESETEDEEVKMNCVGGFRGVEDSDMNSTDGDSSFEEDDDVIPEKDQGVVQFVSNRIPLRDVYLIRPKATTPTKPSHSPSSLEKANQNVDDNSLTSESSRSSIGARGIRFTLGTPSALSEASCVDDNDDDDVDDNSDDSSIDEDSMSASSDEAIGSDHSDMGNSIDELNEDDELSDILQSLGEDRLVPEPDDLDASERFIGVMEDRDDLVTVPKAKRVLSYNTLTALNIEARGKLESLKRLKADPCMTTVTTSLLTSFSLGPPAWPSSSAIRLSYRTSPLISSSDEGDEFDRQLEEELIEDHEGDSCKCGNKTPVPLLTPPGSPLTVEVDGDMTTLCEWPSNLAVDSALTAASELRTMSPASLIAEGDIENLQATNLTPLLRGIYVGP